MNPDMYVCVKPRPHTRTKCGLRFPPQYHISYKWSYYSTPLYRVIHKSLRDFRPLRYSSRDGHAERDHVNRGRDTPSFCPTLQVLDMLTSEGP